MVPIPMSDVHLWSPGPKLYFSLRHFSTTGRAGLAFPSKAEKGSLFEGPLQGREAQSLKLDLVIFYPVILCRVCEGFSSALEISTFEAYPWKRVCPPHTHPSLWSLIVLDVLWGLSGRNSRVPLCGERNSHHEGEDAQFQFWSGNY